MPYYFVCDGGGSKTESLLFDERGRILASAQGKGANALFLPPEQAGRQVLDQLNAALKAAGALRCSAGPAPLPSGAGATARLQKWAAGAR